MKALDGSMPITRDAVLATLELHAEELRRLGARSLALFGSVARGSPSGDRRSWWSFSRGSGRGLCSPTFRLRSSWRRPSMPRDSSVYLEDVLTASERIASYVEGYTRESFGVDPKCRASRIG